MRRDRHAGLRIGTFIAGYPGSPLGGYDLALQQNRELLAEFDITHQMGQNEELSGAALMGTQMLERYPHSRYDGVTGIWYGKGPGLDAGFVREATRGLDTLWSSKKNVPISPGRTTSSSPAWAAPAY